MHALNYDASDNGSTDVAKKVLNHYLSLNGA